MRNPAYKDVFAFTNDFAALLPEGLGTEEQAACRGLVRLKGEGGVCRVVCFSPRHDLTLADMDIAAIERVICLWRDEYDALAREPIIEYVLTFENKGEIMGASNPHPHGQIWATSYIPTIPTREIGAQVDHFKAHGEFLLHEYMVWEISEQERIVSINEEWVALVPFWASWPFEVAILPRQLLTSTLDLYPQQIASWASILQEVLRRYDGLFGVPFPYSMGLYQHPTKGERLPGVSLYQAFYPPLLRSASVRKFMVGFELSAELQRDITPEFAAAKLRESSVERRVTHAIP
jgi:UDPglucose--hexose-1-phosphate uridylyltransferase